MQKSVLADNLLKNLRKDFKVEYRNRYALNISLSFAVISTLSISLASGGINISDKMQAMLLWIILFFCAMNALSHIFIREQEHETALFLRLNAKPAVVLFSKLIFNISLFFLLQAVIVPLFIFFLNMEVKAYTLFAMTMIAGGLAVSSTTTILAAITSGARGRGPLFTVISFPVLLPVIWVASESTSSALAGKGFEGAYNIIFLFSFAAAIITISFILFDFIWLDE